MYHKYPGWTKLLQNKEISTSFKLTNSCVTKAHSNMFIPSTIHGPNFSDSGVTGVDRNLRTATGVYIHPAMELLMAGPNWSKEAKMNVQLNFMQESHSWNHCCIQVATENQFYQILHCRNAFIYNLGSTMTLLVCVLSQHIQSGTTVVSR